MARSVAPPLGRSLFLDPWHPPWGREEQISHLLSVYYMCAALFHAHDKPGRGTRISYGLFTACSHARLPQFPNFLRVLAHALLSVQSACSPLRSRLLLALRVTTLIIRNRPSRRLSPHSPWLPPCVVLIMACSYFICLITCFLICLPS